MNQVTDHPSGTAYDAWLASACMPPDIVRQLTGLYHDAERCHHAFQQKDAMIQHIIPPRFFSLLEKNGTDEFLKRMTDMMDKYSINIMGYDDPCYPDALKQIDQAPAVLFWQGNLQCLKHRMLAMVGSRAASYAGQKAARKLAEDLSRRNVSIVSGLACGIDAASHQGCIAGGSPTVAVTASGLDSVYPRDNIRLRDEILSAGGLILTEYAPGERPMGWHFPYRNRIIAGLAAAMILIEAKIRSGSMTSVHHALDQGKDVFVYPGEPESEHFEGNHQLLREGGIYFTSADDILEDLHWLDNHSTVRQNIDCSIGSPAVSPEQAAVIRALEPGKLSFGQLLDKTGLETSVLMSTLTVLQISGQIEALPGKQYQLKQ